MTRVISVRGKKREELEADPNFVYVGRAVRYTTWDQRSEWANPFRVYNHGPQALDRFIEHINRRINEERFLLERLQVRLRGKTLGCWCGEWSPDQPEIGCHAVVLAKLAEGLPT